MDKDQIKKSYDDLDFVVQSVKDVLKKNETISLNDYATLLRVVRDAVYTKAQISEFEYNED